MINEGLHFRKTITHRQRSSTAMCETTSLYRGKNSFIIQVIKTFTSSTPLTKIPTEEKYRNHLRG